MLWTFARRPRALTRVRGLMTAISSRYAARAARAGGLVPGGPSRSSTCRCPRRPHTSRRRRPGSATGIEVVAPRGRVAPRRSDGPTAAGATRPAQSDILTTLAVAELLGQPGPGLRPGRACWTVLGDLVAQRGGRPALRGTRVAVGRRRAARVRGLERAAVPGALPVAARAAVDDRRARRGCRATRPTSSMPACSRASRASPAPGGDRFPRHGRLRRLEHRRTARPPATSCSRWLDDAAADDPGVADDPRRRRRVPGDRGAQATGLEERLRTLFARWVEASRTIAPDLPVVPLRADGHHRPRRRPARRPATTSAAGSAILKADFPDPPPEGVVRRFPAYLGGRQPG